MTLGLAGKTLVAWLMLGLSGMMLGCSIPDGSGPVRLQNQPRRDISEVEPTVGDLQSQLPNHLMTSAFRRSGRIWMELKHGSPSEAHWSKADEDAHSKCREWGYEEAEVMGTNHFEFLGSSTRTYECRGTNSPPAEATTASGPGDDAEAARTTEERPDKMQVPIEQGHLGWQAVAAMQRRFAELRSRAEQGDAQAQDVVAEIQDSVAELQSRAEQGDPKAQRGLAFMSLVTSDKRLQIETWHCFELFDYDRATALLTLIRVRSGGEDVIGEVSIAGISHMAQFQVAGLTRRWDFGHNEDRGTYRYAFVIEPDGTGGYYDFSTSEDGRTQARDVYKCQLSP